MNKLASLRRIVARYRIAAEDWRVKGEWSNFSGYQNTLDEAIGLMNKLANKFDSSPAKRVVDEFEQLSRTYRGMLREHDLWFKGYEEGSAPPPKLEEALDYWVNGEMPSVDSFTEVLDEGNAVKALHADYKKRDLFEKAVDALYDFGEGKGSEASVQRAKDTLRRLDVSGSEKVYRDLSEYAPDALSELEGAKAWIEKVLKAETREEVARAVEPWEDAIIAIGDEHGETIINAVLESEPVHQILERVEGLLNELSRCANRLLVELFPGT